MNRKKRNEIKILFRLIRKSDCNDADCSKCKYDCRKIKWNRSPVNVARQKAKASMISRGKK